MALRMTICRAHPNSIEQPAGLSEASVAKPFDLNAVDCEWDKFVARSPHGHHEQSSAYAKERERYGFRTQRVVVNGSRGIVAGAQCLIRRTTIGRLGIVQRGPLADSDDPRYLDQVVRSIDLMAVADRLLAVRVDLFPTQCAPMDALERHGFKQSTAWIGKRHSRLVNLSQSDSEILEQMRTKGRYNLRLAERKGVVVNEANEDAIDAFYSLHCESSQHHSCPVFPIEYFRYVWKAFVGTGRAAAFVASYRGQPVAAIVNTIVGGRTYYGWGGLDRRPEHARLMANYLLHFRAMQWAREYGCTHYDLCGDTEFKRKLGGEAIQWPLPLRKFYGPLAKVRKSMVEFCGTRPRLRRFVDRAAARIGYRPRMPY